MPLIVDVMTANVVLILHLGFLPYFLFLDASPWLFSLHCNFASLFLDPLLTDVFHAMVTKAVGLFLPFYDTLVCYMSWRSSSAFVSSWWRLSVCCGVSDTFNAVGCLRATCWSCLATKLSPASTYSCLHGRGWGKRSRMYNVLIGNLYHIWQHYSIDGCQEYDWHNFLGSLSDLRCKFYMCSGKHTFQENFKEEFIPYIAVLQIFTVLNWILAIFTISLCLMWVIIYKSGIENVKIPTVNFQEIYLHVPVRDTYMTEGENHPLLL